MPGSNYDRDLSVKEGFVLSKFLVKWEMILVYILILLNLVLLIFKPELFFQAGTIQTIINSGFDSSPLVLGMVFILLLFFSMISQGVAYFVSLVKEIMFRM